MPQPTDADPGGQPRRPLAVRVTLTVEVDRDDWNAEYSAHESDADIREAIRYGIRDAARAAYAYLPVVGIELDR